MLKWKQDTYGPGQRVQIADNVWLYVTLEMRAKGDDRKWRFTALAHSSGGHPDAATAKGAAVLYAKAQLRKALANLEKVDLGDGLALKDFKQSNDLAKPPGAALCDRSA